MKTKLPIIFILITAIAAPVFAKFQYRIPDTGQTKCYDNEKEIPCPKPGEPFYGQDGNYTINPPSYTKLDENGRDLPDDAKKWVMVRDNNTGLIWEVKTDDGSVHDKDNMYNWEDAQRKIIPQLNRERFGGYSNWRMPMIEELRSIVIYGKVNPSIDKFYFPKTNSGRYISQDKIKRTYVIFFFWRKLYEQELLQLICSCCC